MAVRIDEFRQQHLFAEIDSLAGVMHLEVIKSADIRDPISRKSDRAVFNGRSIHCRNDARANDHL